MTVEEARALAAEWARAHAAGLPGVSGAFLHGSVCAMPAAAALPPSSDVDIMVVADEPPPLRTGKFAWRDLLLEVSTVPPGRVASPEQVLADYPLAGSFRVPGILLDPSGRLTRLQKAVAPHFAERRWVNARRLGAERNARNCLAAAGGEGDFHDLVMACAFGAGILTHILLVAGLRNPTVRRRYAAVRDLLREGGREGFYEELLDLLGCRHWSRAGAASHLAALAEAYDAAGAVARPDYRFAADLSEEARTVAIGGSIELIARGDHREAAFWMVAVASRCQWVFHHHGTSELVDAHREGYRRLVEDLGMATPAALRRRARRTLEFLPRVQEVADAVMSEQPGIGG